MSQQTEPRPLTLDQVLMSGTYYGVKIADIGEDCERVFAFTHDERRAIAATRAHIRAFHGETADTIDPGKPQYVQIFDECGCPEDLPDDEKGDNCEHFGVPPCRDEFGWMSHRCEPDAPNAIAVIELEWGC